MGVGEYFNFDSDQDIISYLLENSKVNISDFEKEGWMISYPATYGIFLSEGFPTESKKIELYSNKLKRLNFPPLPTFQKDREDLDLKEKYPLTLTSGAKVIEYTHSQFRNIQSLRSRVPAPTGQIHPDIALRYQINHGDLMEVFSEIGLIKITAEVTDRIIPGVVNILHGWNSANVNEVMSIDQLDPISGFPQLKSYHCQISKVNDKKVDDQ